MSACSAKAAVIISSCKGRELEDQKKGNGAKGLEPVGTNMSVGK